MANFKERPGKSKSIYFDIDGVLSLQTISLNSFGIPNRLLIFAMLCYSAGCEKGIHIGIISGSRSKEFKRGSGCWESLILP